MEITVKQLQPTDLINAIYDIMHYEFIKYEGDMRMIRKN